eukprot:1954259-Amphidinium_carterae.1
MEFSFGDSSGCARAFNQGMEAACACYQGDEARKGTKEYGVGDRCHLYKDVIRLRVQHSDNRSPLIACLPAQRSFLFCGIRTTPCYPNNSHPARVVVSISLPCVCV